MNNLQIFSNEEFGRMRTVTIDGEPWFVGKDVAKALGYENTKDAIAKHVDPEDKIMGSQNATPSITDSLGRIQYPTWINESGVYSLIFGSKLESAKRFKHWVTSEVLPALRKEGYYDMPGQPETDIYGEQPDIEVSIMQPDIYLEAARIMASVPNSQRYTINCLRHVVPDIDEAPTVTVQTEDAVMDIPASTDSSIVKVNVASSKGCSVPFNARKLDAYMSENNLTTKELSKMSGVSCSLINRYRNGETSPGSENRTKITRCLSLPDGYFNKRVRRTR